MGDSLMVNLMPLNEEEKQQLAANPHNANAIVFNRGMNMAKMIGSSARTSKVYTYMKDHYLNLVIVAKDYDDNGARGSGVMMVSKQDNSNDVLLTYFIKVQTFPLANWKSNWRYVVYKLQTLICK